MIIEDCKRVGWFLTRRSHLASAIQSGECTIRGPAAKVHIGGHDEFVNVDDPEFPLLIAFLKRRLASTDAELARLGIEIREAA